MGETHHLLTNFVAASALGVILLLLAQRLKVSAIVVLLLGGIVAGPSVLGIVHPGELGGGLNTIVSLAVGLILFEGGLTLDMQGFRQSSKEIQRLLSVGVLVTWFSITLLVKLFFSHFSWSMCLLSASLIIVTGPTVIGPLLQRIRVKKNLNHILHWEGVLIDPIGVFCALLCYEWIVSTGSGGDAFVNFGSRFLVGLLVGIAFGTLIYQVLKRHWVPEESLNIFVLVCAMLSFAVADHFLAESGLLSVTVAGILVGYKDTPRLDRIIEYKEELRDYLIGLLFILLAANLDLSRFLAYGVGLVWIVLLVMFLVRPLNIFLSTWNQSLNLKEKLFLSWIAPRGIVAASMASLFAFSLAQKGNEYASFLEAMTYSVIAGTVVFQGFTAKAVGRVLGVLEPVPKDWLIGGAPGLARQVAKFIEKQGVSVVLLDTNPREVKLAKKEGLTAYCENAMTIDPEYRVALYGIGHVLAVTENEDLNVLVCQRWRRLLSHIKIYRWAAEGAHESSSVAFQEGEVVWREHQLKALLASSKTGIKVVEMESGQSKEDQQPLMWIHNGDLRFTAPEEGDQESAVMLGLVPVKTIEPLPIRPEWISFRDDDSLESLYKGMLAKLKEDYAQLDTETLLRELLQREEEFTSLIGHGISLPHTYTAALDSTILMVGRVEPAIPCQHTNDDINLVFLLLSPLDRPVEHLNLISRIAKLVMREDQRGALLAAEGPGRLFKLVLRSNV